MNASTTIEQIQTALAPIAQKIGEGTQHGWIIVVQQQYVTAWIGLMYAVIGLILLPFLVKGVKALLKKDKEERYTDYSFAAGLLAILGGLVLGLAIIIGLEVAITHFLNPEYYALDFFISLVHPN